MRHLMPSLAILAISLISASARGDDPPAPPPELKVLNRLVGTWEEVLTNKPTEWKPKAERSVSITKRSWSLGGQFLRMDGAWEPAKSQFVCFVTYDPVTKEYRNWYFESASAFPRGTTHGAWNEATKTMTWSGSDEFGNTTEGQTKFIDDDHHEWNVVTKDPDGKTVLDLHGTNTRRKE